MALIIISIIAAILAMPFILAIFANNEFTIHSEVIINKSKEELYNYLRIIKNQDNFSKWVMKDINSRREFIGTDGTVGFVFKWDSDNKEVGKGEQIITNLVSNEKIEIKVIFIKPFAGTNFATYNLSSVSDQQTKVTWIFAGPVNYMMKVMHIALNLKSALKKDMTESLGNLKKVLEK